MKTVGQGPFRHALPSCAKGRKTDHQSIALSQLLCDPAKRMVRAPVVCSKSRGGQQMCGGALLFNPEGQQMAFEAEPLWRVVQQGGLHGRKEIAPHPHRLDIVLHQPGVFQQRGISTATGGQHQGVIRRRDRLCRRQR